MLWVQKRRGKGLIALGLGVERRRIGSLGLGVKRERIGCFEFRKGEGEYWLLWG